MNPLRATALLFLGLVSITGLVTFRSEGPTTFDVDSKTSRVVIDVGKSGALSFLAGHTHEVLAPTVRGTIHFDAEDSSRSDVRVEFDAAALRVTGKGEPPDDVPKVQQIMLSEQVLDVHRYPTVIFQSTNVAITTQTAATLDLAVTGELTLHNVTRRVTVPVSGRLDAGALTVTGRFLLKQTDYGIKPVSVGGVVAVKDGLTINFSIVARERRGA